MKLLKVKIPKVWEWQGTLSRNRIKDIISTRGCKKSVGGGEEKGPGLIYCESLLLQLLQPRWPETKLAKAKVDQFRPSMWRKEPVQVSTMQKTGLTNYSSFSLKKGITYMNVITMGQSTTIFLCIRPFSAWWQTPKQPANLVILEQACSWPVRR